MTANIRSALLGILAFGAIFAAFSELWFYRLTDPAAALELIAVYGLLGQFFALTLRRFQVRGFTGFFVTAGLFGFMIEGIPVPVLYQALPFSIAWTSLAWHALLSIGVGYFLYRRVMAAPSLPTAIALNAAIGMFLGIWNAYSWNATSEPGSQQALFIWQPFADFANQFLIGYVMFVAGHLLLDRFPPSPKPASARAYAAFAGLIALAFVLGPFLAYFPLSMILPLLALLSVASLTTERATAQTPWLSRLFSLSIAPRRYATSLALPASALASYALVAAGRLEWQTNAVVGGATVAISSLLWIFALLRDNRGPDPIARPRDLP
jgi:hypothetical protein